MVPRYPFHVMLYWVESDKQVKVISFDTLPAAMACYSENIGRSSIAKVEVGMTVHSQTNPTAMRPVRWRDI